MDIEAAAEYILKSLLPGRMVHIRKGVIAMKDPKGLYLVRNAKDSWDQSLPLTEEEAWMRLVQYLTESYPTPCPELGNSEKINILFRS